MSVNLGAGCLLLFLLPFAMVGVFTGGLAVQRAAAGNWGEAFLLAVFALTFGGVGIGGIAAVVAGKRKAEEQAALEARHPDSPWLWRQDWASGHITDASRGAMFGAWIIAAFWNLISLPAAAAAVGAARTGNTAAYLALLFPLVGLGLIVWAVRLTLRYRKYGISRLELGTVPAVVGHTLRGVVRAPASIQPQDGFEVTLTCIRRITTGHGKSRSTRETIVWQEERRIQGEPARSFSGMETRIPVAFRLPGDAVQCDESDQRDRVLWRLQVSAQVPGVDYEAQFEVPVFRTAASDKPLSTEDERLTHETAAEAGRYEQPADSRIVVTTNRRGTEILFPAARNPGAAAGLTLFLLLWVGSIGLQINFGAPAVFPVVTGVFGLLILIGVLDLWLGVSRVTVDGRQLTWGTGYLYPGRERTLSASDVAEIRAAPGMQSGSTVYYDVVIVQRNGKKIKAGRGVRDKREAEWLAATLRGAISR